MRKFLFVLLAFTSTCFSSPFVDLLKQQHLMSNDYSKPPLAQADYDTPTIPMRPFIEIEAMLRNESNTLSNNLIDHVITTLKCTNEYGIDHNNILTIIDYSLPSSKKRLWVFDLRERKLLFYTYVSHGIKSGSLFSNYFSNKNNSKASSIGVYKTDKAYYGREGMSLRLNGIDPSFNDNANNRSVVMHGGWYVEEAFIQKYGRAGRSWGCPAVPIELSVPIIKTIKENSMFVVYYPSDSWFQKSKFLNCESKSQSLVVNTKQDIPSPNIDEQRESIVYVDLKHNEKHEENDPILVMPADKYQLTFHRLAPVERMLRRQVFGMEYIALSNVELSTLVSNGNLTLGTNSKDSLKDIYFVIPEIIMVRGYYETQMKLVPLGTIKEVRLDTAPTPGVGQLTKFTAFLDNKPQVNLRVTNQFIRWVGL